MPPFDAEVFAMKPIGVQCENLDERAEFIANMREHWPAYMESWHSEYDIGAVYVVGYHGEKRLMVDQTGSHLRRSGYTIITYRELCSMSNMQDKLGSLDELLK